MAVMPLSPDGAQLATISSLDKVVRLWNPQTGQLHHSFAGHTGSVKSAVFSPDSTFLATGSDDNTLRVRNSATGEAVRTLTGHTGRINAIAFSPDGALLATGSDDNTVRIWG